MQKKCEALGIDIIEDPRFSFVDGFYSDTLTERLRSTLEDLVLVNIDVDLHVSGMQVFNFIGPLLRKGVIIYIDEWKPPGYHDEDDWAVGLAFKQWHKQNKYIKYSVLRIVEPNKQHILEIQ